MHLDTNYNTTFAVMHEDYQDDAIAVEMKDFVGKNIKLYLLSPVDLAVSKIARFEGPDREDIASLARAKLINSDEVAERAEEALIPIPIHNVPNEIDGFFRLARRRRSE